MAEKPNNRKFVTSLEENAVETRVLTTMALAMYDASEMPETDEEGREAREALQWCLIEMQKRSRTWHDLMTAAAMRVDRAPAN